MHTRENINDIQVINRDEVASLAEVARELCLSETTMRTYISSRDPRVRARIPPTFRWRGRRWVLRSELQKFLMAIKPAKPATDEVSK